MEATKKNTPWWIGLISAGISIATSLALFAFYTGSVGTEVTNLKEKVCAVEREKLDREVYEMGAAKDEQMNDQILSRLARIEIMVTEMYNSKQGE